MTMMQPSSQDDGKERASDILLVRQDPTSLREKTLDKLREAIISGYFEPGQRLVERDICAKTDVSRTSLREALRHLESEGLVVSKKGHGVYVASLSTDDIRDIYEVRMALDAEAARRFALRATEEQRERIVEMATYNSGIESSDFLERQRTNIAIFEYIHEGSGNKLSLFFTKTLRARTSLLRGMTIRKADDAQRAISNKHILGIAEAIRAGDGELAASRMRAFVTISMEYALEVFTKYYEQTTTPKANGT
jgi:DNA-binding GntR family transcriptional regulator